ncbi:MAG: hypothetical protein JJ979_25570 [Roseibium sp.]|nr:hypothetical protein [Roseibium sp.]
MDIEHAKDLMRGLSGLFVGLLSDEEQEAFRLLKEHGLASDSYQGGAGLLGLSKVKLKTE